MPAVDFLYGWLCCSNKETSDPYDGLILGRASGRAGHGNTFTDPVNFYQSTYAHELGHMFGHEPEENSRINQIGLDVINRVREGYVKRDTLWEIMCQGTTPMDSWISIRLWNEFYHDVHGIGLYPEEVSPSIRNLPPLTEFQLVSGFVPSDSQQMGELGSSIQLENYIDLEPRAGGAGLLRLLDEQGGETYSTTFGLDVEGDTLFSVPVPGSPSVHTIQLFREGVLQDVMTRTVNAPEVTIDRPLPGETLGVDSVVEWTASDADGDELLAYVLYSHDGGNTWTPIRVRKVGASAMLIGTQRLPAAASGIIQMLVSDGLNTASAEVSGLELAPNKPPSATIESPADGDAYRQGVNMILAGNAFDLEDGWIDVTTGEYVTPQMDWYSNLDGYIGSGAVINAIGPADGGGDDGRFTPGTHVVEFRVVDSDGASTSDYVTVEVE